MNAWLKLPIIQAVSFRAIDGELGLSVNEAKSGLPLHCLLKPHQVSHIRDWSFSDFYKSLVNWVLFRAAVGSTI